MLASCPSGRELFLSRPGLAKSRCFLVLWIVQSFLLCLFVERGSHCLCLPSADMKALITATQPTVGAESDDMKMKMEIHSLK